MKYILLIGLLILNLQAWAEDPICIIGAGASGVAMAAELVEMGYGGQIKIFEKSERVGGKCRSEHKDGDVFEMGAVLAAPTYKWVRYFADKVGHKLVPHERIKALTRNHRGNLIQDMDDYYNIPSILDIENNLRIIKLIKKYNNLANQVIDPSGLIKYENLTEVFYYLNEQGEKELKSFTEFAHEQKLVELLPWFEIFVNSFGYLPLDRIPALYVVDYINNIGGYWAYLKGLASTRTLEHGYEVLLAQILSYYQANISVVLGARVKQVDRESHKLTYEWHGVDFEQDCAKFVIATEPGPIINLLDNLSPTEKLMRDSIVYSPYRTIVLDTNIPPGAYTLPYESTQYEPGQVVLIANNYESGVRQDMRRTLLYTVEDSRSITRSLNQVVRDIRSQLRAYGFRVGEVVREFDQELHQVWPNYFPHYKNFILDQIADIQGERDTYYIGPAYFGFELVERAMSFGAHIAHKYFSNAEHPVPDESRFDSHTLLGIPNWRGESDK